MAEKRKLTPDDVPPTRPSLIVRSYNGHLFPVHVPTDLARVSAKFRPLIYNVAKYAKPRVSEGIEYATPGGKGEPVISELPECLEAVSCLIPIHSAAERVRWGDKDALLALYGLEMEMKRLREKRLELIRQAYDHGQPITPEECRKIGKEL